MLRADTGIVEAGRDRDRFLDLADLVLHQVAAHAVDDTRRTVADRRTTGRLDADQTRRRLVDEPGEDAHRVRAAADTRDHDVGWAPEEVTALRVGLLADDALELTDHVRVRVRADHGAEAEVGVADVGHPVAHRFVDGVLERAAPALHRLDLGTEQLHAEHVQRLAFDVDGPHVDLALQPHQGRRGRAGDAVLPGAGVGDDPLLAHPLGEQGLSDHVVDLVGAGVIEILALEDQPDPELDHRGCDTR